MIKEELNRLIDSLPHQEREKEIEKEFVTWGQYFKDQQKLKQ